MLIQEELDTAVIKYITYMKDEQVKTTSEFEKMFTKMHKQLSGKLFNISGFHSFFSGCCYEVVVFLFAEVVDCIIFSSEATL